MKNLNKLIISVIKLVVGIVLIMAGSVIFIKSVSDISELIYDENEEEIFDELGDELEFLK